MFQLLYYIACLLYQHNLSCAERDFVVHFDGVNRHLSDHHILYHVIIINSVFPPTSRLTESAGRVSATVAKAYQIEEQQTGHKYEAGKQYQDWDGEGQTCKLEAGDSCLPSHHKC